MTMKRGDRWSIDKMPMKDNVQAFITSDTQRHFWLPNVYPKTMKVDLIQLSNPLGGKLIPEIKPQLNSTTSVTVSTSTSPVPVTSSRPTPVLRKKG